MNSTHNHMIIALLIHAVGRTPMDMLIDLNLMNEPNSKEKSAETENVFHRV